MRRGEVWTAAAGKGYAGKSRPVVIIQDDRFDATDSVTVYAFTTDPTEAPLLRIPISADVMNGLRQPSSLMVDKITTMSRLKMGERIGRLADEDMVALSRAIVVFLCGRTVGAGAPREVDERGYLRSEPGRVSRRGDCAHVGHTWRGSSGAPGSLASGRNERPHRAVAVPSVASSPRWVSSSRSEATNQVIGYAVSGVRQDRGHPGLVPAQPESMYGGGVYGGGARGSCCAGAARRRRAWLWCRSP